MAVISHVIRGATKRGYPFVEYSIRGHPRTKIVAQVNPEGFWYLYKVTPSKTKQLEFLGTTEESYAKMKSERIIEAMKL